MNALLQQGMTIEEIKKYITKMYDPEVELSKRTKKNIDSLLRGGKMKQDLPGKRFIFIKRRSNINGK